MRMTGSFLDTDVILYAASSDAAKAEVANVLIRGGGTISVQILNETANVTRRKLGWTWTDIRAFLSTLQSLLDIQPVTIAVHDASLDLAERYQLSIYDALIAAAALQAGCGILWSEDMQHGLVLHGSLRIANPFIERI